MSPRPTLVPVAEALAQVLALAQPLPTEEVAVELAVGRALAAEVRAQRTLPPWDNSAMDGYAVRAIKMLPSGTRLKVVSTVRAGQRSNQEIAPGECARIMTGAPLPPGADAVVMQEKVQQFESGEIELREKVVSRQCVRPQGEDARKGELLLAAGTAIGIPEAALLWAQGLTAVTVHRRPRVAIASTGDELCAVGSPREGAIVDTNSPSLALAVHQAGGLPTLLGIAADVLSEVEALFAKGAGYDVLITSAGASVGDRDFAIEALQNLGTTFAFSKVAIKPGKPIAVGRWGRTLVVCLPGNPISSQVTFELFARPALRRFLGLSQVGPDRVAGIFQGEYRKPTGLTHYVRVQSLWESGTWHAVLTGTQTSGALRSSVGATHLMVVPDSVTELSPGAPVELLTPRWTP